MTEKRWLILNKIIEIIEYESDKSHSQAIAFLNELKVKTTKLRYFSIITIGKVFLSSFSDDRDIIEGVFDFLKQE